MVLRTVLIIQARMASSRLPGKVLLELAGRPMLAQQIRRLKECRGVSDIHVATSESAADEPIVELARKEGVGWFRGDEHDVLRRIAGAAREARADAVVRITADCPLVDPGVVDLVLKAITGHSEACDYASNVLTRTFPRGLDAEALFADVLFRLDRLATSRPAREHVTWFLRAEHPELFVTRSVVDVENNSDLRWTVDTEKDFRVICAIYEALGLASRVAPYREILAYVRKTPELCCLNANETTFDHLPPSRKDGRSARDDHDRPPL